VYLHFITLFSNPQRVGQTQWKQIGKNRTFAVTMKQWQMSPSRLFTVAFITGLDSRSTECFACLWKYCTSVSPCYRVFLRTECEVHTQKIERTYKRKKCTDTRKQMQMSQSRSFNMGFFTGLNWRVMVCYSSFWRPRELPIKHICP
jgi:hypothetical protein